MGSGKNALLSEVPAWDQLAMNGRIVGRGRQVTDAELDTALAAGKLELTRPNAKAVSCVRASCRRIIGPHQARRLFVDGHPRGFLCLSDCWNLSERPA